MNQQIDFWSCCNVPISPQPFQYVPLIEFFFFFFAIPIGVKQSLRVILLIPPVENKNNATI